MAKKKKREAKRKSTGRATAVTRFKPMPAALEEARQYAERLYKVQTEDVDSWLKKAEAFSYLGDDQRVLEMVQGAEKATQPGMVFTQAMLYHLAGVAAMRQGDEKQAKRYWQQALKSNPQFDPAQEKVDEAEELLKPLLLQQRLHISEFSALCMVQIQLTLAKDMPEGAERWLEMWESVAPEHPQLEVWRRQLTTYRLKKMGSKLFSFGGRS